MSKIRRVIPVNAAMHLISRGNNRLHIFNNDADKLRYYSLMLELKEERRNRRQYTQHLIAQPVTKEILLFEKIIA